MNSVSFLTTIIILCIAQLAFFTWMAGMHSWLVRAVGDTSQLYIPTLTEILETVVLALVLCGGVRLVRFFNCIITNNKNLEGTFNKFWFPIIEEILKFGLVYFIAHRHKELAIPSTLHEGNVDESGGLYSLSVVQISIAVLVYNFINFCLFTYRYTPINYKRHYSEFVRLYEMWCEHKSIDEITENSSTRTEAAMMLAESLNDDRKSLYSKKSTITLTNTPKVISVPSINSFNSFEMNKLQSSNLDNVHSDMEPCYNLLDKMYSVSPKNTYHLDTESAIVVSIDDVEDENEIYSHAKWQALDSSTHSDDEDSNMRDSISEDTVMTLAPDCSSVTYYRSYEKTTNCLEKPINSSICSKSTWISHLNALSWLFPFLPLSEVSEENGFNRIKQNRRKVDPRIKKKLSSYQIKNNSFSDGETIYSSEALLLSCYMTPKPSYGSIDLECQKSVTSRIQKSVNERNNILKFQQFAESCFNSGDYDVDSIPIDPIFEIFGITIPDLSPFIFSLIFICRYLFNASSFMIYAYPFLNLSCLHHAYFIAISLSIIKLFNQNYIHSKESQYSVQISLVIEALINIVVLLLSISFLFFSI